MNTSRKICLVFVVMTIACSIFALQPTTYPPKTIESTTVELGNGQTLEVGPNEVLEKYVIGETPDARAGTGAPLVGAEYGSRTDSFNDEQMNYDSSSQTTSTVNLSVPLGEDWEGYEVFGNITSITENRTWIENAGFDDNTVWTYTYHNEPRTYPATQDNTFITQWLSNGHGTGDGSSSFGINGYYYDAGGGLRGYWYDPGDKAYAVQNVTIDRGDITWMGISLDYWADCAGWGSYMTGFFELFVSVGDPDNGGTYLWDIQFDAVPDDNQWYSTGLVPITPTGINLPNVSIWAGLRVPTLEWYRPDIQPRGRLDNIVIYVKSKATPEDINLEMNSVNVNNVLEGSTPIFGLGTVKYKPQTPWAAGLAYANFSWTPTPNPPDPNFDISVDIDVDVTIYARRYNLNTINNTELFTSGDNYQAENGTDIRWETNFYAAVPAGYESRYFYNISIPLNRDIDYIAEPFDRYTNLSSGWHYGDPSDGLVNISVYEITTEEQNGFWWIKGSSPNMITNLELWDTGSADWTRTKSFRANDITRFRATLNSAYSGDAVEFIIFDSNQEVWITLQASVDGSGYATTSEIELGAYNASVGLWEVQAFCNDSLSAGQIHNVGFFTRYFNLIHSTEMGLKYPIGSELTWTKNVTYGELVLLQVRVNDSDNGDLLSGGIMKYTWALGTDQVNDLGTGEYSITLNTSKLASNGVFPINLSWSKSYYDDLDRTFNLNVIYTTDLFSSDAPGIDVPQGYDAELHVYFEDQKSNGIESASISCNWTQDDYTVTPDIGNPGHYTLALETDNATLDTHAVKITATKDFHETRTIILSVQVRELHTSAIPSTSLLSLPVGYTTSFTITYTDTDHDLPITGADDSIVCDWSYYTVNETTTDGVYEIIITSQDMDVLDTYDVTFNVSRYGAQNHTFVISLKLRTHLTSFYLLNPIDPTPYTGNITFFVVYEDIDTSSGIENGSATGYHVLIRIETPNVPSLIYEVINGTSPGEYNIIIPAFQWGKVGSENLTIYANWTGDTVKYYNKTILTLLTITSAPTDIFLGQSPVMTPYGLNVSFTIVYYDVGNDTGIINGTGTYAGNVIMTVDVITPGQSLTQSLMVISEVNYTTNPGEYRISFNTTYLSGLIGCELKVSLNWTKGVLPYYENQTLLVTVYSTYRQTIASWIPLPITPYDELVNLSLIYTDVLSDTIIQNDVKLQISTPGHLFQVFYEGIDYTGIDTAKIQVNTSEWTPGQRTFQVDIVWAGIPYYQNRTGVIISINIRHRETSLTHGSYGAVQFESNLTLIFTYTDLDDITTIGMNGSTLSLDSIPSNYYHVTDNDDGTYTLELSIHAPQFSTLGVYAIDVIMTYGGNRYAQNATDLYYVTVIRRRTQLTSDLPELAPYLSLANITVTYVDENNYTGIANAHVYAHCSSSIEELQSDVNYWVEDLNNGEYIISIDTVALGTFGPYTITITANWTGIPYYTERIRDVDLEVSRRPAILSVSKTPLTTPFGESVEFEITITDALTSSGITLSKSELNITHGVGLALLDTDYILSGTSGIYTISILSTTLTSILVENYPLSVEFYWGDVVPYYGNATTSTEATIGPRLTQSAIISTPPAFYYFNATAIIEYSDYLTGDPITDALVTFECLNVSSIIGGFTDNLDGTYDIWINTTSLTGIGKYSFSLNLTYIGTPYYHNLTDVEFIITVNPVSTTLSFEITEGVTYYVGDNVFATLSYEALETGTSIDADEITTNWQESYGTQIDLTHVDVGVYSLEINTTGLDAQLYSFTINATKYLYQTQSITADIILAAIPVEIELDVTPSNPMWSDILILKVNVTALNNFDPVLGANVTLIFISFVFEMSEVDSGIYEATVSTTQFDAGQYTIRILFDLENYVAREKAFQLRINRVPSRLYVSLNPQIAVYGQVVVISANYSTQANGTPITDATLTYSWSAGSGIFEFESSTSLWISNFTIENITVGSYQIIVQAVSTNYRSLNTEVTIDIDEVSTSLTAVTPQYVNATFGEDINITVYLENTNLNTAVVEANVTYGLAALFGNLIETESGYYTILVPTDTLDVGMWTLTVSSVKDGYTDASIQFTVKILEIPTFVDTHNLANQTKTYGEMVYFELTFIDNHNNLNITNATTSYRLGDMEGELFEMGGGKYSLSFNSSIFPASRRNQPRSIPVSFYKDKYARQDITLSLIVSPIETTILANPNPYPDGLPVHWAYTQIFTYVVGVNNTPIIGANATIFWLKLGGYVILTDLNNGSYLFDALVVNRTLFGENILNVRIQKENYTVSEYQVRFIVREIHTSITIQIPDTIYVGQPFTAVITYWDLDNQIPITDALPNLNLTLGLTGELIGSEDGNYYFTFNAADNVKYEADIELRKTDYAPGRGTMIIVAGLTPEQQNIETFTQITGLLIPALISLGILWYRVLSVPKSLRKLKGLINKLEKGKTITGVTAKSRREILLDTMNEDLEPVGIVKKLDDIALSTVDVTILDVEDLLTELAEVVGLTAEDIDILRRDLDKMRPSERAGFIGEVLKQERARRAREIAEAKLEPEVPEAVSEIERKLTEEELEHLRERLLALGISDTEADLMVEQARSLTKAEIDALLEELGGDEE